MWIIQHSQVLTVYFPDVHQETKSNKFFSKEILDSKVFEKIFEKRWLYTSVGQLQKRNFLIEKSILGWKSTIGKAAFQSNFKF